MLQRERGHGKRSSGRLSASFGKQLQAPSYPSAQCSSFVPSMKIMPAPVHVPRSIHASRRETSRESSIASSTWSPVAGLCGKRAGASCVCEHWVSRRTVAARASPRNSFLCVRNARTPAAEVQANRSARAAWPLQNLIFRVAAAALSDGWAPTASEYTHATWRSSYVAGLFEQGARARIVGAEWCEFPPHNAARTSVLGLRAHPFLAMNRTGAA